MFARKPVDGTPSVKFLLTGEEDKFFEPIGENAINCNNGQLCKAGKKAIVVAGGWIRRAYTQLFALFVKQLGENSPLLFDFAVRGLPTDTPTWVKLHDIKHVASSNLFSPSRINHFDPPPSDEGCNEDGMYFVRDFSDGSCGGDNEFYTTPGSVSTCTNNSLKIFDRTSTMHGFHLDMKYFRHCIESTRTYLLTVRLRLSKPGYSSGSKTECASFGQNCLVVQHEYMDMGSNRVKSILWQEQQALATSYGETITIAAMLTFSAAQLSRNNVYQMINVIGPGLQVDMDFEEFNLYLPSQDLYRPHDQQCINLAPLSADAEMGGYSPFPFYPTDDWLSITIEGDSKITGNHFFKVRGRSHRTREMVGLVWDLEKSCANGGIYLR